MEGEQVAVVYSKWSCLPTTYVTAYLLTTTTYFYSLLIYSTTYCYSYRSSS